MDNWFMGIKTRREIGAEMFTKKKKKKRCLKLSKAKNVSGLIRARLCDLCLSLFFGWMCDFIYLFFI
jgi:hypothetical protein